jgi:hypothetical protein
MSFLFPPEKEYFSNALDSVEERPFQGRVRQMESTRALALVVVFDASTHFFLILVIDHWIDRFADWLELQGWLQM